MSIGRPSRFQIQRPARAVRASRYHTITVTVISPPVNNRNRPFRIRQHREQAPRTDSGSPFSRRQPASANRNSQPRNAQPRSTSSWQSSRRNEPSNRPPSRTFSSPVSTWVNASNRPPPVPNFSLDDLGSFCVNAKFQDEACPICLEPLQEELVSAGNCLHLAHTSCLKRWLARDTLCACPVCRVEITGTSRRNENTNTQIVHGSGWMERMIARQIYFQGDSQKSYGAK